MSTLCACSVVAWCWRPSRIEWTGDLHSLVRALGDALRLSAESVLCTYPVLAAAALTLGLSLVHVLWYPTWSWDCVWYHLAQTHFVIQERSLHYWVNTHNDYVNGYPRLVESFSAYSALVMRSDIFDDASQWLWSTIGAVAIAAWSRRLRVARSTAVALGAMWALVPAVFLQLHTTHADIAAASLLVATAYFLAEPYTSMRSVTMATVCICMAMATKVTGIFYALLLLPALGLVLLRWRFLTRVKSPAFSPVWLLALIAVSLAAGLAQPVHNLVAKGNPFFPARITVPFFHIVLSGTLDEASISNGLSFFRTPGGFQRMLDHWYGPPAPNFPDIRGRPFGLAFPYVILPLSAPALLFALWRRKGEIVLLCYAAAVALMVPAAWWGRYVLAVPAFALVLVGSMLPSLRSRLPWASHLVVGVMGATSIASAWAARDGYRQFPDLHATREENVARLRAEMNWMLPPAVVRARDSELGVGDVWAHDESVLFLGEYWNASVSSKVQYISSRRDTAHYLAEVRVSGARWVSVDANSAAHKALVRELGAELIAVTGIDNVAVMRLPGTQRGTP